MIITTTRHGRTRRDTQNLTAHLRKDVGQVSRVVAIGGVALSDADSAMAYMELMRDGSKADVAYHHITISPTARMDDEQRDEAVRQILSAMDADDHPFVLWEHDGKARSKTAADQHFHLIVGHIGPDGRALRDGQSFTKLEAVARTIEYDLGQDLTHSRRTSSVAAELAAMGRSDVAEALPIPPEPPRSSTTSKQRAEAGRKGVDLPAVQAAVRGAWERADGPQAFRSAIDEMGFTVVPGRKAGVFVVTAGDVEVGALDRIVKERRQQIAQRMKGYEHDYKGPEQARPNAGPQGDLSREPNGSPDSPGAHTPLVSSDSARGRRRDEPSRTPPGYPGGSLAGAAATASILGGSARQGGRAQLETAKLNGALKGLDFSLDAKRVAAQIRTKSLLGGRPGLSSTLLNRQIGSRLDRLWLLAMEVRDVITDIRLRVRFGRAERHSADPESNSEVALGSPRPLQGDAPSSIDQQRSRATGLCSAGSHGSTHSLGASGLGDGPTGRSLPCGHRHACGPGGM